MDIQTFLTQCAGQWFAQRTTYQLIANQSESNKSELIIEGLAPDAAPVLTLCAEGNIAPDQVWGGLAIHWDNHVDWGQTPQKGGTVLALAAPTPHAPQGQLLRAGLGVGTYTLAADESLVLTVTQGDTTYEERIWFASENLRFRTLTVAQGETVAQTAFYSEIRRMQD
ncbi:phycobiliprotein lyase [Spirulina sp. CCNP1310]|uniref:phycobiliprotein lyase n=1 Tax=Spirulina sp. CCNP1310 TaxID=3110249 RepID=UPI002B220709|nr:phycobiliprotein lyase [Spirulina sp. CCNP1310]MEA5420521.1 phycobiliprotein lyase [Spirulina sp. CCNP1310]